MDTRFVVFLVAFFSVFAADCSEGSRKLAQSFLNSGVSWDFRDNNEDTAEKVWSYCKNELKDCTEAVEGAYPDLSHSTSGSDNCIEFDSSLSGKRIIQNTIPDLPPKKMQIVFNSLTELLFQVLRDEQGTWSHKFEKLFSSWACVPRRYLRVRHQGSKHRALGTVPSPGPASSRASFASAPKPEIPARSLSPVPLPSPSDTSYPSQVPNNVFPGQLQEKNKSQMCIIVAVVLTSVVGPALIVLFLYFCLRRRVETKNGHRDEKPIINFSCSDISAGSGNSQNMANPNSKDFKASWTAGSALDVNHDSSEAESQLTEPNAESDGKTAALPLPPGRKAPPPPKLPPGPPPPPPKPPAPAPPPPPKVGRCPPNAPQPTKISSPGSHHQRSSTGSELSVESEAPKTKLKPFFWDKVLANPNHSMVWHDIRAGSFEFNEEMMEHLFGYVAADKNKNEGRKDLPQFDNSPQFVQIIDPKKSQNLAILLKALNVTTEEVRDALKEGNELPAELVQTLLKMAPTTDEELKLRLYIGDISHLGPAERFLKVLVDIPFAFKRLESLLFASTFQEEFSALKESFATLEVACKELRSSRLFLKLLEAVLKTGNRMNDGTYRGGATAFKLDTLLKLSDVKGTDGNTTLLHFVVNEIIRSEGVRAARRLKESQSMSSVNTDDLVDDSSHETEEYHRSLGLQVVSGLSNELENVRKAAGIDNQSISETVLKLGQSLTKTKKFLETDMKIVEGESEFRDTLTKIVNQSESDITWLMEQEKRIMNLVKSTGDYFHGKAGRNEGYHLFVIVRDFLLMLDKACKDVKNSSKLTTKIHKKEALSSSASPYSQGSPPESSPNMHRWLFPAMRERQMDSDFSSDDES